jgi:endoglucanase
MLALLLADCSRPPHPLQQQWQRYAAAFVDGGRVVDRDNGDISHSEGQGYGLLFALAADDRAGFARLWSWTRATLQRDDGLFSWRYRPCASADRRCVDDPNNATDGDVLIAWALLRAGRQWDDGTYSAAAVALIRALRTQLTVADHGYRFLLPGRDGFVENRGGQRYYRLNPSYWIFPAFRDFHAVDSAGGWARLAADGERLLTAARFGAERLHPEWFLLGPDGVLLAEEAASLYAYNACRVPLHLAWDPATAAALLKPYRAWWSSRRPVPAWLNLRSGDPAPYAWGPGMKAIAALVGERARAAPEPPAFPDVGPEMGYFQASLVLLSQLAWRDLS